MAARYDMIPPAAAIAEALPKLGLCDLVQDCQNQHGNRGRTASKGARPSTMRSQNACSFWLDFVEIRTGNVAMKGNGIGRRIGRSCSNQKQS